MRWIRLLPAVFALACGGNSRSTDTPDAGSDAGSGGSVQNEGGSSTEAGGGSGGTPASCDDLAAQALARFAGVRAANDECGADADCSTVNVGGACLRACIVLVNASNAGAVESAAADLCRPFAEAACEPILTPCLVPGEIVCNQGRCAPGSS